MNEGLVFACLLDGKGGGKDLTAADLKNPKPRAGILWMHIDYRNAAAGRWIRTSSGIEPLAIDALLDEDSRPRMVQFDDGLLLILRGVNFNKGAKPEDMVSVRIWAEANRIITTRHRKVGTLSEFHEQLLAGKGPTGPGDFILRLAAHLDSNIEPVIDRIDEEVETAESNYSGNNNSAYRGEFGQLRRRTAHLRRYLAPQRDTLERLSRQSVGILSDDQRNGLREEADAMTRHLEDLDLARERAMVAQEELLNTMAQEQNSRMYVLSLVAAIFLPLAFLTGLMGMNVAGLPGTDDPAAFVIVVVLMLAAAAVIALLFRWKKWL